MKIVKLSVLVTMLALGVAYTSTSLTGWSPVSVDLVNVTQPVSINSTITVPDWVPAPLKNLFIALASFAEGVVDIASAVMNVLGPMLSAVFLTGFFIGSIIPIPLYVQTMITVGVNSLYVYSVFQLVTGRAGKVYD